MQFEIYMASYLLKKQNSMLAHICPDNGMLSHGNIASPEMKAFVGILTNHNKDFMIYLPKNVLTRWM